MKTCKFLFLIFFFVACEKEATDVFVSDSDVSSVNCPTLKATHLPVTLYKDKGFAGTSQELGVGNYPLSSITIGNDALSSIRVAIGYQVTLYKDDNYGGTTKVITSDDNLISDFNDCMTSLKITTTTPTIGTDCVQYTTWDNTTKSSLLTKYAPRIYLYSGETYWPSSVEWSQTYLTRYLEPSVSAYCYKTTETMSSPSTKLAYFVGNFASAKVYSFLIEKDYNNVDLSYWVYFPYNLGKIVLSTEFGDHVGDWEHVTVRLAKFTYNNLTYVKPTMVSIQAHTYVSQYTWSEFTKTSTTHVVAYCAKGSHGMWLTSGTHTYADYGVTTLKDYTDAGTTWDTWLSSYLVKFQYNASTNTGTALGTTAWPSYFNTNYTVSSGGAIYYWGNQKSGSVLGYYRLETGPRGPENGASLTDYVTLK